MNMPLFSLGNVVATPNSLEFLKQHGASAQEILARHQQGDWGEIDQEDAAINNHAVENGERLFSAYALGNDHVWVITERDRSVTTILLPEDY